MALRHRLSPVLPLSDAVFDRQTIAPFPLQNDINQPAAANKNVNSPVRCLRIQFLKIDF
jgi:hypothetical protein